MDFSQNTVFGGLGTVTFSPPAAGLYTMEGKITLPMLSQGASEQSQLVVTINLNGSPIYTTDASSEGFRAVQSLLTSDVITIVFSSSALVDQAKNVIKSCISISAGE